MLENFEKNLTPEQPKEHSTPEIPEQQISEIENQPKTEMPEDFEDPEGKQDKWKTVKGEVEIEGKKVEVSYREKVIELPEYRQKETGIKRIRRRELLPPFPEGLYLSAKERKEQLIADEKKKQLMEIQKRKQDPDYGRYSQMPDYAGMMKLLEDSDIMPAYQFGEGLDQNLFKNFAQGDDEIKKRCDRSEGFDNIYRFLTDNKFPTDDSLIHILEYGISSPIAGYPGNLRYKIKHEENVELFKREGMYFQELYSGNEGKHNPDTGGGYGGTVWFARGRPFVNDYATPVFVFHKKNKKLADYLESTEQHFDELRYGLKITKDPSRKSLRWCNADVALIPTKRSLNVLFFETGDEKETKKETKKGK